MIYFVFYAKLMLALFLIYRLMRTMARKLGEPHPILLAILSFIVLADLKWLTEGNLPEDLLPQVSQLLILLYLSAPIIQERDFSTPFVSNLLDFKQIFKSRLLQSADEGVALLRKSDLACVASNDHYLSLLNTGRNLVGPAELVSAFQRGDHVIETVDFHNEHRFLSVRIQDFGRKYAIIYLNDVTENHKLKENAETLHQQMKSMWDSAPYLVMIRNFDGTIDYMNDAFLKLLEKDSKSVVGTHFLSIYEDYLEAREHQAASRLLMADKSGIQNIFIKRTDAQRRMRFLSFEESVLLYDGAQRVVTKGVDVTDAVYSNFLAESYADVYRLTQDSDRAFYLVADLMKNKILFSGSLDLPAFDIFINELDLSGQESIENYFKSGVPFEKANVVFKNTYHFDIERVYREANGNIVGFLMQYEDFTRQGHHFSALGELITNNVQEGIVLIDKQGKIEYVNEEFLQMFGYTADQISNINITDISLELTEEALKHHWEISELHKRAHREGAYLTAMGESVRVDIKTVLTQLDDEEKMLLFLRKNQSPSEKSYLQVIETRHKVILDNFKDDIFEMKLPLRQVFYYRGFDEEGGLNTFEMSYNQWMGNVHELDRQSISEAVQSAETDSAPDVLINYRYYRGDEWHWVRASIRKMDDETLFFINHDLDDVMKLSGELKEINTHRRMTEKHYHMAGWRYSVAKNQFESSEQLGRLFNVEWTGEDIYYEQLMDYIHADDRAYFEHKFYQFIWSKEPFDVIIRTAFVTDVQERFLRFAGNVAYDEDLLPLYAFGDVQDVTERAVLRRLSDQYRTFLHSELEQSDDGMAFVDLNGNLTEHNASFEGFLRRLNANGRTDHMETFLKALSDRIESQSPVTHLLSGTPEKKETAIEGAIDAQDYRISFKSYFSETQLYYFGILTVCPIQETQLN
jgi:PAS domain S-box-containing protein